MEVLRDTFQITNSFIEEFIDELDYLETHLLSDETIIISIHLQDDTTIQVVQKNGKEFQSFHIRYDGNTVISDNVLDNITRIRLICEDFKLEFVDEEEN